MRHSTHLCSVHDVERKYYADGEDAYSMRKLFKPMPENGKGRERHRLVQ